MPRYPSFGRNRFPSAPPHTFRVGAGDEYAPAEIDYARRATEAGLNRTGSLYAHFRRFTADWNDGECDRCFYGSGGAARAECDVCYGTGWRGGYSRPTLQRMLVVDKTEEVRTSPAGFLRLHIGDSYSPGIPRIAPTDILVHVQKQNARLNLGDRYVVENGVEEVRSRDETLSLGGGADDHLVYGFEVIGYRFRTSRIPPGTGDFTPPEYRLPLENPVWLAD